MPHTAYRNQIYGLVWNYRIITGNYPVTTHITALLHEIMLPHGNTGMLPLFMYIYIHKYMVIYICYRNVTGNIFAFLSLYKKSKKSHTMFLIYKIYSEY